MPENRIIRVFNLIAKLRYKYRSIDKDQTPINKIVWWSIPVVYPNHDKQFSEIAHAKELRHQKKKRVNRMIREMFQEQDHCFFVTFTFRDDVLSSTSERTRHRYVADYLGKHCRDYVANVDYGRKTGREHYHAVVSFNNILPPKEEWPYGFFKYKPINKGVEYSHSKITAYIVKLVNHAGKVDTGRLFRKRGMKTVDNLPF